MTSHAPRPGEATEVVPTGTIPGILDAIDRRSAAQARDLASLRAELAALAAGMEADAAHLGEVERDLAQTRAALGNETEIRMQAEARCARLAGAMATARTALDVVDAGLAAAAPVETTDPTVAPAGTSEAGDAVDDDAVDVEPGESGVAGDVAETPPVADRAQVAHTRYGSGVGTGSDGIPAESPLGKLIAAIERRGAEQDRDMAALRERLAAMTAEKEVIAARLCAAAHDLAETRAALESETTQRTQAEVRCAGFERAVATARAALADMGTAPADPAGPATERGVSRLAIAGGACEAREPMGLAWT